MKVWLRDSDLANNFFYCHLFGQVAFQGDIRKGASNSIVFQDFFKIICDRKIKTLLSSKVRNNTKDNEILKHNWNIEG